MEDPTPEEIRAEQRAQEFLYQQIRSMTSEQFKAKVQHFSSILNECVQKLPTNVQEALSTYWEGKQVRHPGTGELVNAPLVLLDDHIQAKSANNPYRPCRAGISTDNLIMLIDPALLLAPNEVIEESFAFLLASAYIDLAGLKTEHVLVSNQVQETYHTNQKELTLAYRLVDQWGFDSDLLCYWEVAVKAYGTNWPAAYKCIKAHNRD